MRNNNNTTGYSIQTIELIVRTQTSQTRESMVRAQIIKSGKDWRIDSRYTDYYDTRTCSKA